MLFEIDIEAGDVTLSVQSQLYSQESIEGAAHAFGDVADVYVDDESEGDETIITLELKKNPKNEAALKETGGNFLNELLNQVIGKQQLAANKKLNRYIITKALMSARRDAADPLQPPAADDEQLTDEQKTEAASLLKKAEEAFEKLQKDFH